MFRPKNKKNIDSQESASCRGKNNILHRDLDIYKRCMFKEFKLEVNKSNRHWRSLNDDIICLSLFKKFQFETELAYQTNEIKRHVEQTYSWMAPDDRKQMVAKWTNQVRNDLLKKLNPPTNKWKEILLNEKDPKQENAEEGRSNNTEYQLDADKQLDKKQNSQSLASSDAYGEIVNTKILTL